MIDNWEDDNRSAWWQADEDLPEQLTASREDDRRFAIIKISRACDDSYVPELLERLGQETYANRRHIVRALGKTGGADVGNRLVELLNCEDGLILGDIAQSLGRLGFIQAVPILKSLKDHELEWVQQNARWALKQFAGTEQGK